MTETTPRGIVCQYHGYRVLEAGIDGCPACARVRATRPAGHYSELDKKAWYRSGGFIRSSTTPAAKPNTSHETPEYSRVYGEQR